MEYRLIRSKRRKKTMTLKVNRVGDVIIYVPFKTPQHAVENFFKKNIPWIQKKMLEHKTHYHSEKRFIEGEGFFYLGNLYPLYFSDKYRDKERLDLIEGHFLSWEKDEPTIRHAFIEWYKKKAFDVLSERVFFYSTLMGLFPTSIKITNALKRYGSCSCKNSLCFSWRIVMAPPSIVDYVVVHELSHIKEKNHSKDFWRLVERFIPDYKSKRRWLKENSHIFYL